MERPILHRLPDSPVVEAVRARLPRARGHAEIAVKARGTVTAIDRLQTSGCMKMLFPRCGQRLDAIVINTAGGVTGGDKVSLEARVGAGAQLGLTTQAAERAYRAKDDTGRIRTAITVAEGGLCAWMPQELILFDGASLDRDLRIDLAADARLLMVEPVVFGRTAMGETVTDLQFRDRIDVRRDGQPLYRDGVTMTGNSVARLAARATGQGAAAMASVLYVAPDAEAHLEPLRAALPQTAGATLLRDDVLCVRMVAPDSFHLRTHLLPVLDRLSTDTLPLSWRL